MNPLEARNRYALVELLADCADPKYLFFSGHRAPKDGSISQSCLSQWYPSDFEIDGCKYYTAEQFMMAEKARLFGDHDTEERIMACRDPHEAKKLGRGVKDFNDSLWKESRYALVVKGNLAKFSQNRELADFLKSTSQQILVEASPVDRIWGIGLAHDHPDALVPAKWTGLNLLGFALMEVRSALV